MEDSLERWRYRPVRRGMKVSKKKSESMCVNKREKGEHVRSRDHKDR